MIKIPVYTVDASTSEADVQRRFLSVFEQWQRMTQLILFVIEEELTEIPKAIRVIRAILKWQTRLLSLIMVESVHRFDLLAEEAAEIEELFAKYREPLRPKRPFPARSMIGAHLPDPSRYDIPSGQQFLLEHCKFVDVFDDEGRMHIESEFHYDLWEYSTMAGRWLKIEKEYTIEQFEQFDEALW